MKTLERFALAYRGWDARQYLECGGLTPLSPISRPKLRQVAALQSLRLPYNDIKIAILFLIAIIFSINLQSADAQDWNQWRGPNRDGALEKFSAPANWPKDLTRKWEAAIGGGYSSPVVSESKIFILTRKDFDEAVSCIDLNTGKTIWSNSYPAPFTKNPYAVRMEKGPYSTPLVHAGKLYTLGTTAILSCYEAGTGKLIWRRDYSKRVDTSKLFCGSAMSPIIDGKSVIVHVGDDRRGWMIAADTETGYEKWRWEGDGPGYASPVVAEFEGARQIVTLTDKSVIGIAASSGKLLWSLPHKDEWNENIITPILHGKTLIISGVRQGTRAIEIKKDGEAWATKEVWHNPNIAMYMSSPVLDGDLLYGLSNLRKGQYFCLDAKTGKVLWTTEGREGSNASIIGARNLLFILTTDADLIVAKKSDKGFEPITRYTVANRPTWSNPIIMEKHILIKDASTLTLWSF